MYDTDFFKFLKDDYRKTIWDRLKLMTDYFLPILCALEKLSLIMLSFEMTSYNAREWSTWFSFWKMTKFVTLSLRKVYKVQKNEISYHVDKRWESVLQYFLFRKIERWRHNDVMKFRVFNSNYWNLNHTVNVKFSF